MPRDDIPPRSYGPLLWTTLRIVTWNVWGRYGPWPQREAAIIATLQGARPDVVVLTEAWGEGRRQPVRPPGRTARPAALRLQRRDGRGG